MEDRWLCYYCERGWVKALPARCPECRTELRKPVKDLSPRELDLAYLKKLERGYPLPDYSLAS